MQTNPLDGVILPVENGGTGLETLRAVADAIDSAVLKQVANNSRLPYTYNNTLNWCHNAWIKHKSGPSGARIKKVAFLNGINGANSEIDAYYDFTIRCGIYVNGKFTQGKFNGQTDVNVVKEWGLAVADFDVYVPPNTEFYTTNRRVATDYATAATALTGYTNTNPVVMSAASHGLLAGQSTQIKDLLTNQTGTVAGVTNANPCSINSVGHGLTTGQAIRFASVGGTVELNWTTNGSLDYKVVVVDADNFTLQTLAGVAINSTAYGVFTTGGTWTRLSELNYSINGSVAYTVANPTGTTFELAGINGTTYGVYGSGGVADRVYRNLTSHAGNTHRADGVIASRDINADYTMGVGVAYGAKVLAPVINSSGVITSVPVDPLNLGVNYSGGLNIFRYYGPAGRGVAGSLVPSTSDFAGYGNSSGGKLSSITITSGGSGFNPNNPPTFYVGGAGISTSGFGTSTATYGPAGIFGVPDDDSLQSILLIGDSNMAGYSSSDGNGDIYGNFGYLEQTIQNRAGVINYGVSSESASGWNQNNTKQLALYASLAALGVRFNSIVVGLASNDFTGGTPGSILGTVQSSLASIITSLKAIFPTARYGLTTVKPNTTSTDSFVTTANQTYVTNYEAGGPVDLFNAACRAGTGAVGQDFFLDPARVVGDPTTPTKWRVAGTFYLGAVTATAFTTDGVHFSPTVSIPYLVANLDLTQLLQPSYAKNIIMPKESFQAQAFSMDEHQFTLVPAASAVALTTATPTNIASITLGAGQHNLRAKLDFSLTGATASKFKVSISKISATHGQPEATYTLPLTTNTLTDIVSIEAALSGIKVPERSTATYYIVAEAVFSAGTVAGSGIITKS